jgi:hypothetical protein
VTTDHPDRTYDIYLALTHPEVSCKEAKSEAGQARLVDTFERELSKGGYWIAPVGTPEDMEAALGEAIVMASRSISTGGSDLSPSPLIDALRRLGLTVVSLDPEPVR